MGFEDVFDIDLETLEADLDKLDREAAKAEKQLESIQKKAEKKGPIFSPKETEKTLPIPESTKEGKALPATSKPTSDEKTPVIFGPGLSKQQEQKKQAQEKQDQKIEKKFEKLSEKVRKDTVKQFGKKEDGILSKVLGDSAASNIFSMGKNPIGFVTNIAKAVPFLGGVFAAKEIAEFIIDEIAKIDRFFKKFIDRIDNRVDQLMDKIQQAHIAAGRTQLILTTRAGTTNARDAYNTFEQFNNNRDQLEADFAIRNTSGVD